LKRALIIAVVLSGCTPDFEDETTVKDLRFLGLTADTPELLFDGGELSRQAQICPRAEVLLALQQELAMHVPSSLPTVTLRPLVADPAGGGRSLHYRAVACVSPVDRQGGGGNQMPGGVRETIGRGACPADAPLLAEGDVAPPAGSVTPSIEVPLALTGDLLIAALRSDPLGIIYGLALTVQVTVSAGEEEAIARKRVLINVRLSSDQTPNNNPLITGVTYRRAEEDRVDTPFDLVNPPTVRLGERLRIQPLPGDKEGYPTRVGDRHTGCVQIERVNEALRRSSASPATTPTSSSRPTRLPRRCSPVRAIRCGSGSSPATSAAARPTSSCRCG
jgi:hypothetical protein